MQLENAQHNSNSGSGSSTQNENGTLDAKQLTDPYLIHDHPESGQEKNIDQIEGTSLARPIDKRSENPATWRVAEFTLIFPLNTETNTPIELRDWTAGRDTGIKGVNFGDHIDLSKENKKNKTFPKTFNKRAKSFFKDGLAKATRAPKVDLLSDDTITDDKHNGAFYHRKLKDTSVTLDKQSETPGKDKKGFRTGYLCLRSIELAQYFGRMRSNKRPQGVSSSFLILHVIGEYLTNQSLEAISKALHRPRNKLELWDGKGTRGADGATFQPLCVYVERAIKLLQESLVNKDQVSIDLNLEGGGYLFGCITANGQKENPKKSTENTYHVRPFRLVSALPMTDIGILREPEMFNATEQPCQDLDLKLWGDRWCWILASGMDEFSVSIPDFSSQSPSLMRENDHAIGDYLLWRTATSSSGVSYVKVPTKDPGLGFSFVRLLSSRFTDLALLNMRAQQGLALLRVDLVDVHEDIISTDPESLQTSLENLNSVQRELASFRNELWFRTVPAYEEATAFLQALQRQSGSHNDYEDFLDEITLQKEIVDTLYKQAVEKQRDDEERLAKKQEQENNSRNQLLSVLGAALASPGVVELLPTEEWFGPESLWPLGIALALFIMFVLIGLVLFSTPKEP